MACTTAACSAVLPLPPGERESREGDCPSTVGQEVLEWVNRYRGGEGLPPLVAHAALARAAAAHSADMAGQGVLSHTGSDGSSVSDRVRGEGYRWALVAENVGGGYSTPRQVVAGWMASPGHRSIILTPGSGHAGAGYVSTPDLGLGHFWTLVVTRPAAEQGPAGLMCHP